jgi:predicted permease
LNKEMAELKVFLSKDLKLSFRHIQVNIPQPFPF